MAIPRLSFCISVFNDIHGLKYLLNGLVKNILKSNVECEILIYNDGGISPQNEILPYTNLLNIHLYESDLNCGLFYSRNILKSSAIGEYVLFLDSDDYFTADIEQLVDILDKDNCEVYFFNFRKVVINKNKKNIFLVKASVNGNFRPDSIEFLNELTKGYGLHVWQIIFKRNVLSDVKFSNRKRGSDMIFIMDILKKIDKIHLSSIFLYDYFQTYSSNKFDPEISNTYKVLIEKIVHNFKCHDVSSKECNDLIAKLYLHWFVYVVPNSIIANRHENISQKFVRLDSHFQDKWLRNYNSIFKYGFPYNVYNFLYRLNSSFSLFIILFISRKFGRKFRLIFGGR
jgi:hypothetical protein